MTDMNEVNRKTAFEKVRHAMVQKCVSIEQQESLVDFNIKLVPNNRWEAMILLSAARLYRGTGLDMAGSVK